MSSISDVSQGPGWWQASNGRWYPPEARAPSAPPPPLPSEVASTAPSAASRPGRAWGTDYWTEDATFAGRHRPADSKLAEFRGALDWRGAFVAIFSVVLLVACTLPYYRVTFNVAGAVPVVRSYAVVDSAFGSWRAVIPAVAVVTIVCGVVNSFLRVGSRGAVSVFVGLRLLAFVQLGLWILAAVERHVPSLDGTAGAALSVSVTWTAWGGIAAAAIALVGSFAAITGTSQR